MMEEIQNILGTIAFILFGALILLTMLILYSKYRIKRDSIEEIEKEKKQLNIYKFIFNMVGIIDIYLIYVWGCFNYYYFNRVFLYIPAIIFIIAFIVKLAKYKKIGNIIYVINCMFMILIGVICAISVKKLINHNEKISKYIEDTSHRAYYFGQYDTNVYNINELIQTIIEINKSDRKVSIQYKDKTYCSEEELEELLKNINTKIRYNAQENYDIDGIYKKGMHEKYNQMYYINSIKLRAARDIVLLSGVIEYIGENQKGSDVKTMIAKVIKQNDLYIGESGGFISIKVADGEEIPNLKNNKGEVDLKGDSLSETCDKASVCSNTQRENTKNVNEAKKEMKNLYKAINSEKSYKIELPEDIPTIVISQEK